MINTVFLEKTMCFMFNKTFKAKQSRALIPAASPSGVTISSPCSQA